MWQSQTHDDYVQTDDALNFTNLYSVSQRVLPPNSSYSNLSSNNISAVNEQVKSTSKQDWETVSDNNREIVEKKQSTDVTTSASGRSSTKNQNDCIQGIFVTICIYLHNRIAVMLDIENIHNVSSEQICEKICNSEELGLGKHPFSQIFSLWMISPLLELQLKPTHKPHAVRRSWRYFLEQYSHSSYNRQQRDEPRLVFQRNLFFSPHLEEKIKDQKLIELLYEEARHNILQGRYPCEEVHYIMLGGIQARIELGPYNPHTHSIRFFREEQVKYLPLHIRKSSTWTWLPISSKNSAEVKLLEQFKRIPNATTNRKLMKKYLEFCWSLPFYGSAFFEGQIEQPVTGLSSLITFQDQPVLVAINLRGIYVIDDIEYVLLLGLKFEEFSWEYARPSNEENPNCLPCLFIQFNVVENGSSVSKILQIFSRQASLMDTLIGTIIDESKSKITDETDKPPDQAHNEIVSDSHSSFVMGSIYPSTLPSLSTKLNRLTLATFDEDGHCIGQMGSWSFSY